jgi:kynurenine 3-monooxygenase
MAIDNSRITIVGAGLVGSLLAIFLGKRGFTVEVFERRPDMRTHAISAGRSINLAISTRGINALEKIGLAEQVLGQAVPMKGRMIHSLTGDLTFQPYGKDDSEFINSISRATLNKMLMTAAESTERVTLHFNKRITGMDLDKHRLYITDEDSHTAEPYEPGIVIGTDGSASAVREDMLKFAGIQSSRSVLEYGYKELVIPPGPKGEFQMERNALHIWPRGTYMLIALPNFEGSYTCTLFLPFEGNPGFSMLEYGASVERFFNEQFGDAVPLISDLASTFNTNPTGHMVTIKCERWSAGGQVLLMGDAAHGIVPFFGQGMNCGFEDCTIFAECMDRHMGSGALNWRALFEEFESARVPNTDAIADMAVENFVEMRDKVADPRFLMEKAVEKILQKHFPGRYVSRYSLVTFSNVPYKLALDAGIIENEILAQLCDKLGNAEQADLKKAERLIDEKLAPLLAPYASELSLVPAH